LGVFFPAAPPKDAYDTLTNALLIFVCAALVITMIMAYGKYQQTHSNREF
jgi:hypothetical protein